MSKCALCGYETASGFVSCSGCSVNSSCRVTRCPHCGYRFVEESQLVRLVRRWLKRRAGRPARRGLPVVG